MLKNQGISNPSLSVRITSRRPKCECGEIGIRDRLKICWQKYREDSTSSTRTNNQGIAKLVKAWDFDSHIRWFDSSYPCHYGKLPKFGLRGLTRNQLGVSDNVQGFESLTFLHYYALIAQLVEHLICNLVVGGSIPFGCSKFDSYLF